LTYSMALWLGVGLWVIGLTLLVPILNRPSTLEPDADVGTRIGYDGVRLMFALGPCVIGALGLLVGSMELKNAKVRSQSAVIGMVLCAVFVLLVGGPILVGRVQEIFGN